MRFLSKWMRRLVAYGTAAVVLGGAGWVYSWWSGKYALRYNTVNVDSAQGFGTSVSVINLSKESKSVTIRFESRTAHLRDVFFLPVPEPVTPAILGQGVRLSDPAQKSDAKLFPNDRQPVWVVRSLEAGSGCSFTFVTDVPAGDAVIDVFSGRPSNKARFDREDLRRWFVWATLSQWPLASALVLAVLLLLIRFAYLAYTWPTRGGLAGVFAKARQSPTDDALWESLKRLLVPSFQTRVVERCLRLDIDPSPALVDYFWEYFKTRAPLSLLPCQTDRAVEGVVDFYLDLGLLNVRRR